MNIELAEKVAERLGWHKYTNGYWEVFYLAEDLQAINVEEVGAIPEKEFINSWQTVGLCVEKAKEKGWQLNIYGDEVSFKLWIRKSDYLRIAEKRTNEYNLDSYSYIKAILKAFSEIPKGDS